MNVNAHKQFRSGPCRLIGVFYTRGELGGKNAQNETEETHRASSNSRVMDETATKRRVITQIIEIDGLKNARQPSLRSSSEQSSKARVGEGGECFFGGSGTWRRKGKSLFGRKWTLINAREWDRGRDRGGSNAASGQVGHPDITPHLEGIEEDAVARYGDHTDGG